MTLYEYIGKRRSLSVTQREVERKLSLTAGAIGCVENGRIPVAAEFVDVLNTTLDEIVAERRTVEPIAAA